MTRNMNRTWHAVSDNEADPAGVMRLNSYYFPRIDGVDYIDEEIRDVMWDINALPFVDRTLWSCAGYGVSAGHDGHEGRKAGYVTINYLPHGSEEFRDDMWRAADARLDIGSGVVSYYVYAGTHEEPERSATLSAKWDRVREVVARHAEFRTEP